MLVSSALLAVFSFSPQALADVRMAERFSARPIRSFEHIALPDPIADLLPGPFPPRPFLLMPADGRLSSGFGWREDPIDGGRRLHAGVDVANLKDTRVVAVAAGSVRFAGWAAGCGRMAVVEHGDGVETRYCHLEAFSIRPGDAVAAGSVVGRMGDTGRATGMHLHFEVRADGHPVDPAALLMF